jgi:Holliday junction resolvasome RuvABC endonuclease subunit
VNILALDLGTKTGFALAREGMPIQVGTWKLATAAEVKTWGKTRAVRTGDPRFCRLLVHVVECFPLDVIVFEDVLFGKTTKQTQLWSSLRSVLWTLQCSWEDSKPLVIECVPVQTLKKFATGNGSASKDAMIAAAIKTGLLYPADDNQADAFHLLRWAQTNLRRIQS